jgi:hypothetical protein
MFCEYIDVFMKIFLNDFIVLNDLLTHLEKFRKCLFKCRKFGISLNPNKCTFMVFSGTFLSFIVSKKGKVMDPKKFEALVNMPIPTTPRIFKFSMGWHNFTSVYQKLCFHYVTNYQTVQEV